MKMVPLGLLILFPLLAYPAQTPIDQVSLTLEDEILFWPEIGIVPSERPDPSDGKLESFLWTRVPQYKGKFEYADNELIDHIEGLYRDPKFAAFFNARQTRRAHWRMRSTSELGEVALMYYALCQKQKKIYPQVTELNQKLQSVLGGLASSDNIEELKTQNKEIRRIHAILISKSLAYRNILLNNPLRKQRLAHLDIDGLFYQVKDSEGTPREFLKLPLEKNWAFSWQIDNGNLTKSIDY